MIVRIMRTITFGAIIGIVATAGGLAYWALTQTPSANAAETILDKLGPPVEHALAEIQPGEVFLGDEKAPVTIVEYASFSCPHCANFHKSVLPELKARYLDTGKAKLVLRDFPLNKPAMEGALLARCVSPMAYWAIIDQLFSTQEQWVTQDSLPQLAQIAATAGVSQADFEACQSDQDAKNAVLASLQQAQSVFGVNSTPTLVINGIVLKEDNSLDAIGAVIDALSPAL